MHSDYHTEGPMPNALDSTASLMHHYRIPPMYQHQYVGFESFRRFLILLSSQQNQQNDPILYAAVFQFNSYKLAEIEERALRRELPRFTALVDDLYNVMIVKLMPGMMHNRLSRTFVRYFDSQIMAHGVDRLLLPGGSGRIPLQNNLNKEPDEQFKPSSRGNWDDYPTFVVEIGVSETLPQLRQNARLWLTNTDGRTRIVLLIYVHHSRSIIRFERWQNEPKNFTRSSSLMSSGSAPVPGEPANMQVVEYHHRGEMLTGEPLVIPVHLLFDVVPANLPPSGISIGSRDLLQLGAQVFAG
ncbi:hypothetical protein Plec18167_008594 [Paecilomyces lecythidis]|uniref:Uncharacterized protein n=1 Tax=Paecilomyces lecythidis TaxID=3004212 RepID=A0ABR3WV93_9EURO